MERQIVEALRLGKGTNTIARELGVCKKTVKRVKERAEAHGYLDPGVALPGYPALLFPAVEGQRALCPTDIVLSTKEDWIRDRLLSGWHPVTVFEELSPGVSQASFYRYLSRAGLSRLGRETRRVIPEIVTAPGESLQIDWGRLDTEEDENEPGKRRIIWALVGVLGYSRYRTVRLVRRMDVGTTLCALESIFSELGGVPRKVTTDNPKCISLEASAYEARLHPVAERFAAHYGFVFECLPPRDPQKKGKVERVVPFLRRLFEPFAGQSLTLEEKENRLREKLGLANERRHGSTKRQPVIEFRDIEQSVLRALPPLPYEPEETHLGVVRQDGHVRFRNKYYSVPEAYIGKEVLLIGTATRVSIYHKGELVETHERLPAEDRRTKSTKPHHRKPWERSFEDTSYIRARAQAIGPSVDEMVVLILGNGDGFIDTRKIWGILTLDTKYDKHAIDAACRRAIELDRIGYLPVMRLLEDASVNVDEALVRSSPTDDLHRTNHKFTRTADEYAKHFQLSLNLQKGGSTYEH